MIFSILFFIYKLLYYSEFKPYKDLQNLLDIELFQKQIANPVFFQHSDNLIVQDNESYIEARKSKILNEEYERRAKIQYLFLKKYPDPEHILDGFQFGIDACNCVGEMNGWISSSHELQAMEELIKQRVVTVTGYLAWSYFAEYGILVSPVHPKGLGSWVAKPFCDPDCGFTAASHCSVTDKFIVFSISPKHALIEAEGIRLQRGKQTRFSILENYSWLEEAKEKYSLITVEGVIGSLQVINDSEDSEYLRYRGQYAYFSLIDWVFKW